MNSIGSCLIKNETFCIGVTIYGRILYNIIFLMIGRIAYPLYKRVTQGTLKNEMGPTTKK